jgi:hypothetical protein
LDYDKWYYWKNISVNSGQKYYLRGEFEQVEPLGNQKYFFGVKPSGETLQQAIANGHFYYIDPWSEGYILTLPANNGNGGTSNPYGVEITVNVSNITLDNLTGHSIMNANRCLLYWTNETLISSVSMTDDFCDFDVNLTASTAYYIHVDGSGGAYTRAWYNSIAGLPYDGVLLSVTDSLDNNFNGGYGVLTNVYKIGAVRYDYSGGASDSCTYSSGNWEINSSDYCNITSNVDVGGNNITIMGEGTTRITANITGYTTVDIHGVNSSAKAIVECYNGVCFK